MICDNCGTANAAGTKFCKACGHQLPREIHTYGDNFVEKKPAEPEAQENSYRDNIFNAYRPDEVNQSNFHSAKTQRTPPENQSYGQNNQYRQEYYGNQGYNPNYRQNNNPNQYHSQNAYNGYQNRVISPRPQRSVGAIVFFMINGAFALLTMLMTILPSMDFGYGSKRYVSAFAYAFRLLNHEGVYSFYNNTDVQVTGLIVFIMFAVPMIFQLLWAIFSFTRVRAAGGMGLVGSILFTMVSCYWVMYLLDAVKIGRFYFYSGLTSTTFDAEKVRILSKIITVVPFLMVFMGIAGIVLSSIEIAKGNRVR